MSEQHTEPTCDIYYAPVITRQDLENSGPQVSFDSVFQYRLPENVEVDFDTGMYTTYLYGRGLNDEQVNAACLNFVPTVSPLRLHRGSYNPRSREMTVHVPHGASSKSLTRSAFHTSEYYIQQQLGRKIPRDYRDYLSPYIGSSIAIAAGVADLALRADGVAGNAEILQSLTYLAVGDGLAALGIFGKRLVYPPEIVRHARKAERRADGRPLVTFAPLKDSVETATVN